MNRYAVSFFLTSLWVGIVFCAPLGAITAESLRRGVARGFVPALFVQVGSLVGDATWAMIALVGLAFLVQNTVMRVVLALVGAALLLYLARSALQDAADASDKTGVRPFVVDLIWGGAAIVGLIGLIQGIPFGVAPRLMEGLRWPLGVAIFLQEPMKERKTPVLRLN